MKLHEKKDIIVSDINNTLANINEASKEEKVAFLKGIFLSCGSVNDPKKNKYHLEFFTKEKSKATLINKLLHDLNLNSKILKRDSRYIIYIKESEKIGDFLRIINAVNALLYYENIRIYHCNNRWINYIF